MFAIIKMNIKYGGIFVNIIFDDGKTVIYRGNIDGKYYDVSYDKVHRRATIIIYSNILGVDKKRVDNYD